ncbi:putative serine/threonine-protein kinase iks1, partial [Cladochytrium tenue]
SSSSSTAPERRRRRRRHRGDRATAAAAANHDRTRGALSPDDGEDEDARAVVPIGSFVTDEYFRILERSRTADDDDDDADDDDADDDGRDSDYDEPGRPSVGPAAAAVDGHRIAAAARRDDALSSPLNQGYYDRFFVQVRRLGRGQRGSVFLVKHVLEGVVLGEYAVKSIPVGVSHSWLVRQLQEVHLLERLRIENKQLSVFGPEVPCLFILMQLANGGSLDEYIQVQNPTDDGDGAGAGVNIGAAATTTADIASLPPEDRARALRSLRELRRRSLAQAQLEATTSPVAAAGAAAAVANSAATARLTARRAARDAERARRLGGIGPGPGPYPAGARPPRVRYLTTAEIRSFAHDICLGLRHLHRNGIIHRDLKPQNLLLEFVGDRPAPGEIPRVLISDFGECEIVGDAPGGGLALSPSSATAAAAPVATAAAGTDSSGASAAADATAQRRPRTGATGTLEFLSPELLERDAGGRPVNPHSVKGDMFSLGVVL